MYLLKFHPVWRTKNLDTTFFRHKIFWDTHFLDSKFFGMQKDIGTKFFEPYSILTQLFLDPKWLYPNFMIKNIDHQFFLSNISFNTFGPKKKFLPGIFHKEFVKQNMCLQNLFLSKICCPKIILNPILGFLLSKYFWPQKKFLLLEDFHPKLCWTQNLFSLWYQKPKRNVEWSLILLSIISLKRQFQTTIFSIKKF